MEMVSCAFAWGRREDTRARVMQHDLKAIPLSSARTRGATNRSAFFGISSVRREEMRVRRTSWYMSAPDGWWATVWGTKAAESLRPLGPARAKRTPTSDGKCVHARGAGKREHTGAKSVMLSVTHGGAPVTRPAPRSRRLHKGTGERHGG